MRLQKEVKKFGQFETKRLDKFKSHYKFYYDVNFNLNLEVKIGLYQTLDKMCPDIKKETKIDSQIDKFHKVKELFRYKLTVATRDKKQHDKLILINIFFIYKYFCK